MEIKRKVWRIVGYVLGIFLYLLCLFMRVKKINHEEPEKLMKGGKVIFCFWHRYLLPLLWAYRKRRIVVITSMSRDGEIADAILHFYGYETIRGSSSRGGINAIIKTMKVLKQNRPVAIAVDGPRGPAFIPKDGAFFSASRSEAVIIPVFVHFRGGLEIGSWDRLILPLPFSKATVIFGKQFIPSDVESGKKFFMEEMKRLEDDFKNLFHN
jgi:lysophospholipid acyltransferase (LPLAT)-like uncharacterized protein